MARHYWTKEEAQLAADMITGCGNLETVIPKIREAIGLDSLNRDQLNLALTRHLGASAFILARKPLVPRTVIRDSGETLNKDQPESTLLQDEDIDWAGARPANQPAGVERRVILGDIHIPAHSTTALSCAYSIIRALQPHAVIQIGDLINASAFTRHAPHSVEPERLDLSLMAARGFIRSVKKAAPGAKLYIIRGNHDDWAARWECENPAFQNHFDFETQLGIRSLSDDDRPPPFADVVVRRHAEENPLVLGPVAYIHGNGGGTHPAKRYATVNAPHYGVRQVVFGHHHQLQFYRDRNGYEAWGCGWLGDERQPTFSYAPPPRAWWLGLLCQDIVGDFVTTTPIKITNGQALFGGRLISSAEAA